MSPLPAQDSQLLRHLPGQGLVLLGLARAKSIPFRAWLFGGGNTAQAAPATAGTGLNHAHFFSWVMDSAAITKVHLAHGNTP